MGRAGSQGDLRPHESTDVVTPPSTAVGMARRSACRYAALEARYDRGGRRRPRRRGSCDTRWQCSFPLLLVLLMHPSTPCHGKHILQFLLFCPSPECPSIHPPAHQSSPDMLPAINQSINQSTHPSTYTPAALDETAEAQPPPLSIPPPQPPPLPSIAPPLLSITPPRPVFLCRSPSACH